MTQNVLHTALAVSAGMLLISCGNKAQQKKQEPQGKVKIESISIAPKVAGRIERIHVQEGQQVKQGDTLAIIAVPEINAKLDQANGAITAAQGQLELAYNGATADQLLQIQSQVDAAVAQMEFAEQSYARVKNMYQDSLIPAQQFDDAKAKMNMAKAQVNALRAKQKEIRSGTRPEMIQSARGQVLRARGAKEEVLQADKERYILAPADMTIETISLKQGELATPGYSIMNGYADNSVYFRFTIGENSINAYKTGSIVKIKVPHTNKVITSNIVAVKQMPRYADNTSTSPNRQVSEGFFELKIVPVQSADAIGLYNNSTVLMQL